MQYHDNDLTIQDPAEKAEEIRTQLRLIEGQLKIKRNDRRGLNDEIKQLVGARETYRRILGGYDRAIKAANGQTRLVVESGAPQGS